jgi:hypothetical protein
MPGQFFYRRISNASCGDFIVASIGRASINLNSSCHPAIELPATVHEMIYLDAGIT